MITPGMREHAKRLIARTNHAINIYLDGEGNPAEPMNTSAISCRSVRFCVDDTGDTWSEVVIEEAGDCPKLCEFVSAMLQGDGFFAVFCVTED